MNTTVMSCFGIALALLLLIACGRDAPTSPTDPGSAVLVVFRVIDQSYTVRLTMPTQVAAAHAARGGGSARIPLGRIAPGTDVNQAGILRT